MGTYIILLRGPCMSGSIKKFYHMYVCTHHTVQACFIYIQKESTRIYIAVYIAKKHVFCSRWQGSHAQLFWTVRAFLFSGQGPLHFFLLDIQRPASHHLLGCWGATLFTGSGDPSGYVLCIFCWIHGCNVNQCLTYYI